MPRFMKPKYTQEQNSELKVRALGVLADSPSALTIPEICAIDMGLNGQTPQKMARVLNDLVEAGFVMKTNSKSKGRMVYAAVSQLEDQGYDILKVVC